MPERLLDARFASIDWAKKLIYFASNQGNVLEQQLWQASFDGELKPLTATPGDAARGRAIVANRQVGLCLLCHTGPFPEERFQGNLAPDLAGAGARWSTAQLRRKRPDLQVEPIPEYAEDVPLGRLRALSSSSFLCRESSPSGVASGVLDGPACAIKRTRPADKES